MSDDGSAVTVLVVDDQTVVRESLTVVLDLQDGIAVVGAAADGEQAVRLAAEHRPDVVLMDLTMPGVGGVEATRRILAADEDVAVVVLTTYADDASVLGALGAGAIGYLTKDAGRADIVRAVRAAAAGQAVLDPVVQQRLVAAATGAAPATGAGVAGPQRAADAAALPADLTPREVEVLTLIGEGLSNRAIARRLYVSESTVKTHINNLFGKLAISDRVEAVRWAIAHGLVAPAG